MPFAQVHVRRGVLCVAAALALAFSGPALAEGAQRIVTSGADVTATVFALGAGERVIARDTTSTHPEAATGLPDIGYMRALSPEGILALKPDLVLVTENSGPPATLQQIEAAGVDVETVMAEETLNGAREKIISIAELLDVGEASETLLATYDADAADLARIKEGFTKTPKVLFILSAGRGAPLVSGSGTMADVMIRFAGGENAMASMDGYKPLGLETVRAAAPDAILTTTQTLDLMGGEDALYALPAFSGLDAATRPAVITVDGAYLIGTSPETPKAAAELAGKFQALTH